MKKLTGSGYRLATVREAIIDILNNPLIRFYGVCPACKAG